MKAIECSGLSDEQLIYGVLDGNNENFGVIYSRYFSKVYAKCYSFSRNHDDAFDHTQEILLKAINNAGSFAGNSKFSTWLYSIATNYCITQTVKRNRIFFEEVQTGKMIAETDFGIEEFEERYKREELEDNIDAFLEQLSDEEKEILILKYRKNYSIKDLQLEYNLTASAIKMRLLRARLKIGLLLALGEAA